MTDISGSTARGAFWRSARFWSGILLGTLVFSILAAIVWGQTSLDDDYDIRFPSNILVTMTPESPGTPVAALLPAPATAESPPAVASDAASEADSDGEDIPWFLWLLLFGSAAGLMFLIFDYLKHAQAKFFAAFGFAVARGLRPEVLDIGAFPSQDVTKLHDEGAPAGTREMAMKGPARIAIGAPHRFDVIDTGTQQPATDPKLAQISWTLDAELAGKTDATIYPTAGPTTFLTATKPGQVVLRAKIGSDELMTLVTVFDPAAEQAAARVRIPFVGADWGSLVLAVVLLVIVALLGLEEILSGEAIATILGAIAGYIFGVAGKGQAGE